MMEDQIDADDLISWLLLNGGDAGSDEASFPDTSMNRMIPQANDISFTHQMPMMFGNFQAIKQELPNHMELFPHSDFGISESLSFDNTMDDNAGDDSSEASNDESSGRKRKSLVSKAVSSNMRKKSKPSVDELERRVKELEEENVDLKNHLNNINQRALEVQKQRVMMENLMVQLVNSNEFDFDSQSKLDELLEKYTEIYADYGKSRQREVAFHLSKLEKLVLPTPATKMILWTMQQDKSFAASPIFDEISVGIGLTPEQICKIQERRQIIKGLLLKVKQSLGLIKALRTVIENKHIILDEKISHIRQIATPQQTVKLLLWIAKNAPRIQKLLPNSPTL